MVWVVGSGWIVVVVVVVGSGLVASVVGLKSSVVSIWIIWPGEGLVAILVVASSVKRWGYVHSTMLHK